MLFWIFFSAKGTITSGRILPIVITQATAANTSGSVTGWESPVEIPKALIAASAAGTSYWIAPITVRRIHGSTRPSAFESVSTVATIASAGAMVNSALDTTVFFRVAVVIPSCLPRRHARTRKKTDCTMINPTTQKPRTYKNGLLLKSKIHPSNLGCRAGKTPVSIL